MKNNIGPKRLVVGAHYGLGEFLAQRATAIVMAVYTVVLLVAFLTGNNFSYEGWAGLFAQTWFKLFTLDHRLMRGLVGHLSPADIAQVRAVSTAATIRRKRRQPGQPRVSRAATRRRPSSNGRPYPDSARWWERWPPCRTSPGNRRSAPPP